MAFSGGGGDKMIRNRGGTVTNTPSTESMTTPRPRTLKRDECVEQLERLFHKSHRHIEELSQIFSFEKTLLKAKGLEVSDAGLQGVLQRHDKLVQMSRMTLKRDNFGANSPWGRSSNNSKAGSHRGMKTPDQSHLLVRHGSEGVHGSPMWDGTSRSLSNQSFHSPTSTICSAAEDENLPRRTGAIPKRYNYNSHFTPSQTVNRALNCADVIGHGRSNEDPGAIRVPSTSHDSTYNMSQDDDAGRHEIEDRLRYGSLDRSVTKRKKAASDKSRRHTKAIGMNHDLSLINDVKEFGESNELRPDEQYTFGLPNVGNLHSSKLSTTIMASLSHTVSPKSISIRPQYAPATNSIFYNPPCGSESNANHVQIQTPIKYHSSTLLDESPRGSMFFGQGQNDLLSPIPKQSPFTGEQNKTGSVSKLRNRKDASFDRTNSPVHERTRSAIVGTGYERVVGSLSNLYVSQSPNVVDGGKSGNGNLSQINKESCKPFEMADYYKYSTKYKTQNPSNSSASDATSGSQNERSRCSLSSASSSQDSAQDSGFSARSLILKEFFSLLPYDDRAGGTKPSGTTNSWVPPHLQNWYELDSVTKNSILESHVQNEEAAAEKKATLQAMLSSCKIEPEFSKRSEVLKTFFTNSDFPTDHTVLQDSTIEKAATSGGKNSESTPRHSWEIINSEQLRLSRDENGNNMPSSEQAPELPPRQPRERKDSSVENARLAENENPAWIMDTPTLV